MRTARPLVLIAALVGARAAAAAPPAPAAGAPPLYVIPGDRVRLVSPLVPTALAGGSWLQGVVVSLDSAGLTVRPDRGAPLTFPHAAVARLQVRRRSPSRDAPDAATLGALLGFAAGAGAGALACSGADGQDWVALRSQGCGFAGGLAGAWLGARLATSGREERQWIPVALPLRLSFGDRPAALVAVRRSF